MYFVRAQVLLGLWSSLVAADYLTGFYPPPIDLTSNNSLVAKSWKELSSVFDACLRNDQHTGPQNLVNSDIGNLTFSMGMFSLNDPGAINLQYHYTAPEVATAKGGTNKVDADSIYIMASVSKLITTFVSMLHLSQDDWNRPLIDIHPAFKEYFTGTSDAIWNTQWDQVTLWSLASQLSGLPTIGLPDRGPPGDFYSPNLTALFGAPLVDISTWSNFAVSVAKNGLNYISLEDAISSIANIPPNFQPFTTPAYSDLNFMLLGSLMCNITNQTISALYHDTVFGPLGMTSSFVEPPTDAAILAHTVLPSDRAAGFFTEPIFYTPSGGIMSTIHDLQKLGMGILNNTLLSPEATRRWMKPVSHTASLTNSVGAPWEIHRYIHPNTSKITDLYTKLGSSAAWGGVLVLIPQYDAGFAMLNAYTGESRYQSSAMVLDYVVNYILPGLDAQADAEAKANYVGTYKTSSVPNTFVTIGYNETTFIRGSNSPLFIKEWIYNGTDVIKGPFFNTSTARLRLEPSIPNQNIGGPGQVAFQVGRGTNYLTYVDAMNDPSAETIGPFTGMSNANQDFNVVDSDRWAGVGADMFVFDVDADGRAVACTPAVDRVKLQKV